MGEERREIVSVSEEPVPAEGPGVERVTLEQELDRLSLDQALVDVEIATCRVVDLTQRLVEATDLIRELQGEVEALRQERVSLEQQLAEIRSTKAFRTADRLWTLRQGLRG